METRKIIAPPAGGIEVIPEANTLTESISDNTSQTCTSVVQQQEKKQAKHPPQVEATP